MITALPFCRAWVLALARRFAMTFSHGNHSLARGRARGDLDLLGLN